MRTTRLQAADRYPTQESRGRRAPQDAAIPEHEIRTVTSLPCPGVEATVKTLPQSSVEMPMPSAATDTVGYSCLGRTAVRDTAVRDQLTGILSRDYCNYMKTRLVRIGNSQGIRIPRELVRLYDLQEGAELELDRRREGILVRVVKGSRGTFPWDAAYKEMAAEAAEFAEWSEWDATTGDGRDC